ncbi:glycosyltransferase family 4 protein [Saccharicrinis sp. FJH62]|uniref:glycosyltransferase family 4 protein n=1 Tax=Saccharicrinis sp. FJH62 TaxID=3344657 RepID=UPI0035D3EF0F
MINVLINAYACSPNKGSEPGMAWNWIINIAKYCNVYVITEGEWQNEIEHELQYLTQKNNIHFYFSPVSQSIRNMCWNQGDWRFYFFYRSWQKKTLKISRRIVAEHKIDIIHQLNMIGFREPGYLYRLNKPIIWGPVDAKEKFPVAYLNGATPGEKYFIHLKNIITYFQLKTWWRIKNAVRRSTIILTASSQSANTFKKYFNKDTLMINETGCYVTNKKPAYKNSSNELSLLWVGKFDFRKQLTLALQSLAEIDKSYHIKLHIVGGKSSEEDHFKTIAEKLNISDKCIWHGIIPHGEVQSLMRSSDLLFFTSVAEGTPHVVLESIGNDLPVLCFNTCGQGDVVNDQIGIKIELSNPKQSRIDFAQQIAFLYKNPEILIKLSQNCNTRQSELSWEKKAQTVYDLYKKILL